jgi:protein BCP1
VGTVVKTGEADDPIGVMTVLNLQRYKDKAFLEQLKEFLLEKCEAKELQEKLKQARALRQHPGRQTMH